MAWGSGGSSNAAKVIYYKTAGPLFGPARSLISIYLLPRLHNLVPGPDMQRGIELEGLVFPFPLSQRFLEATLKVVCLLVTHWLTARP
jgi:hypothetical protein